MSPTLEGQRGQTRDGDTELKEGFLHQKFEVTCSHVENTVLENPFFGVRTKVMSIRPVSQRFKLFILIYPLVQFGLKVFSVLI